MSKMKIIFFVSIIVTLSCCSDSPIKTIQKIEIVPLSIGNIWIYQNHKLDFNGNIIKEYYDTLSVIKDTIIDGTRWYTYYDPSDHFWFQNNEFGYRDYTILHPTWDLNCAIYKFPGKAGEEFLNSGPGAKKIDSTDAIYITKIGSFKCFKYIDKNSFGKGADYYVSPGIGLVSRILYNRKETSNEYFIEYLKELVYYKVK